MSKPSTATVPEVGNSSPSSIEIVVVLPAPLPPSSATVAPRGTEKLMASTAATVPKRLVRALTSMTDSGMAAL